MTANTAAPYAELLSRARVKDQPFYLLVDPLGDCKPGLPWHPDALRERDEPRARATAPRADIAHDASICPMLLTLAVDPEALAQALLLRGARALPPHAASATLFPLRRAAAAGLRSTEDCVMFV